MLISGEERTGVDDRDARRDELGNSAEHYAAAVRIPMLHLVEVTAAAARGAGVRTVGLLGAAFTMEQDFYRDRLASHGLTVIVPDAAPSGP